MKGFFEFSDPWNTSTIDHQTLRKKTKQESWQGSEGNWFIHCMWVCKMLRDGWTDFHINGPFFSLHKWPRRRKLRFFCTHCSEGQKLRKREEQKSCKWFITSFQTLVLRLIYLLPLLSCHCSVMLLINNLTLLAVCFFLRESTLYIVWR